MITVSKAGDTIVETIFAITIFAALSVMAIHTMNNGLQQAQQALETTMARNAIDAQAEALRFVHNAYVAEREFNTNQRQYSDIWETIKGLAVSDVPKDVNEFNQCGDIYGKNLAGNKTTVNGQESAFIINPRSLMPLSARAGGGAPVAKAGDSVGTNAIFQNPTLYPRIIYGAGETSLRADTNSDISGVEGIWVIAAKSAAVTSATNQYFDFYIQTCWQSLSSQAPSTLTTIVRLYNPEIVKR